MSSQNDSKNQKALDYHQEGRPGKMEVIPTKPSLTSEDLSLAYSPGVAIPCLEIAKDIDNAYKYTAKGNLVGVISNGSAVLGLGNIGATAGKPVMEGKGMLFKKFADIDVFDIEIDESTVEGIVRVVKSLGPTFGGINLEDIKAPECFEVEKQLIDLLDIPVFHDDQHGTAIIASAGFLNALEITGKDIKKVKVVFNGAGAASIACANLFLDLGVTKENLMMCDSKGVIYEGRTNGMNIYKEKYLVKTDKRTLEDALDGADVFIGCSAKGVVSQEMVKTMADKPIIFAMANPDPEILPPDVLEVRPDAIVATGRSDFPNQVNNVLCFPFLFRGALDVRAKKINIEMKLAAVRALAALAKEEVPEEVKMAYGNQDFSFGANYIIPKPFDSRVLTRVAPAVAKAAMESKVSRIEIENLSDYAADLANRLGTSASFMKSLRDRLNTLVQNRGRKIKMLFAEGANTRILQACKTLLEEEKIEPILLGREEIIKKKIGDLGLSNSLKDVQIIRPSKHEKFKDFYYKFFNEHQRNGISINHAEDLMIQENYFGSMMLKEKMVDAFIAGPTLSFPNCFKPVIKVVDTENQRKAAGIFILIFKDRVLFLADCTAQIDPGAEELSEIAASAADLYRSLLHKEPRIAFLSYSNFGSNKSPSAKKVKKAVELTKSKFPELKIDGEMQADVAVTKRIRDKLFNFSTLDGESDILIFPELNSANISYKLLSQLSDAHAIGPILVPMKSAVNIIQRTAPISEILNICTLTALLSENK